MSLLRSALDGVIQIRADVSGTPAPWEDFWYNPVGPTSSTGMRVTADTAKRLSTVLSCVNKISKTVAMLPLKIYSEQSDGGKKVADNHPIFDVLYSKPNAQQDAFEFRQMMQGHLELRGNAYAEILPGPRGAVDQLMPLHPDKVTPQRLSTGRIRYRYDDPLLNDTRYIAQEEMFHLRNFMDDGMSGQSTVSMAVDTIGLGLAAQDYYARFLKNDAVPGLFVTGVAFKTKQDETDFQTKWQQNYSGANRHKTGFLSPGMDVKSVGVSGKDAELLEARKFSRIEICSIFDVPPHLIGETEKTATYASVEQFNIMFATFCILPRLVLWEQAIQRALIFSPRFFAKFSMGALLRGDNASRSQFYEKMIQMGVFSQNDVRIQEDMNPIPDGDNYWRPLNWARLGDVHTSVQKGSGTEDDTSEQTTDAGEGPEQRAKLKLLAAIAAEPCVRKEVNAIRKINERAANDLEFQSAVADFYRDHATFLSERMRLPDGAAKEYCAQNQQFIVGSDRSQLESSLNVMLTFSTRLLGRQAVEVIQ